MRDLGAEVPECDCGCMTWSLHTSPEKLEGERKLEIDSLLRKALL